MVWTIFATLVILWLLAQITGYILGGLIHVLLLIAVVVLLVHFFQRRKIERHSIQHR